METLSLIDKIESLPKDIQQEIIDLVNSIFNQFNADNQLIMDKDLDLSESQKAELIARHKNMREQPKNNISLADFKKQIFINT
jgi:putative addiction module component (TIGR02574 family)